MSDGHLDCVKSKKHHPSRPRHGGHRHPLQAQAHGNRNPLQAQAHGNRNPLQALSIQQTPPATPNEKRVLVWTSSTSSKTRKVSNIKACDLDMRNTTTTSVTVSPAVYSYKIVNQRLSHIAAFAPPRTSAGPSTIPSSPNIAYRFVFTNNI